jgi:hypothetical protein
MTLEEESKLFESFVATALNIAGGCQDEIFRDFGTEICPQLERGLNTRISEEVDEEDS